MITQSEELLRTTAAIDTSRIAQGRRFLQHVIAKTSALAGRLARIWVLALAIELILGAVAVWHFASTAGWPSHLTIGVTVAFGVLVLLLASLVYVLNRIARLPQSIDTVSEKLNGVIAGARQDYDALQQSSGWLSSIRTLFSAGKLVRAAHRLLRDHEGDVRCLTAAVLMVNPAFWLANVVLAGACVIVPVAAMVTAVLRASW